MKPYPLTVVVIAVSDQNQQNNSNVIVCVNIAPWQSQMECSATGNYVNFCITRAPQKGTVLYIIYQVREVILYVHVYVKYVIIMSHSMQCRAVIWQLSSLFSMSLLIFHFHLLSNFCHFVTAQNITVHVRNAKIIIVLPLLALPFE